MAKINDIVEQRILDSVSIVDILNDMGVELHKQGANLTGLCPFHEDKHLGSFIVSESKNICTCYAGCGTFNPKELSARYKGWTLPQDYNNTLRYMAAVGNIYVDDEERPVVNHHAATREKPVELPMVVFNTNVVKSSLHKYESNPLAQYLMSLPLTELDALRRKTMMELYLVGTSTKGKTAGWTIWWQMDANKHVRTGHMMAYKADGHRDKTANPYIVDGVERYYCQNWVHSMLLKAGMWNDKTNRYDTCLFGEHLLDMFPDAEVCLVESEKTALICSFFTDPSKRIWLATAGMQSFKRNKLMPLIERCRYVVAYPDYDGYDQWTSMADTINYSRLSISQTVRKYWKPCDGQKADIADIMLRLMHTVEETPSERASRMLGLKEEHQGLSKLIKQFNLKID